EDKITLRLLLAEKPEAARRYALTGLRDIGPDAADAAKRLEDAVAGDPSPDLRRLAVVALLAVAPADPHSAAALAGALCGAGRAGRGEPAQGGVGRPAETGHRTADGDGAGREEGRPGPGRPAERRQVRGAPGRGGGPGGPRRLRRGGGDSRADGRLAGREA